MDLITAAWEAHPGMHVYHYAPYEPSAFKRLMGRYATREEALDRLLRGGRFVDLYGVVRQGLRAGIERYSIKNLEVLYGFERAVPLPEANERASCHGAGSRVVLPGGGPAGGARRRAGLQPGRLRVDAPAARLARGAACRSRRLRRGDPAPRAEGGGGFRESRRAGGARRGPPGAAARGHSPGAPRPQRRAAGALAAGLSPRLAPAGGQGGLVGVLPPAGASGGGAARRGRRPWPGWSSWSAWGTSATRRRGNRPSPWSTATATRPRRWRSARATS